MGLRTKIKNIIKKRFLISKEQKQPNEESVESVISKQNTAFNNTSNMQKSASVEKKDEVEIQHKTDEQKHQEHGTGNDKISRHRRKARLGLLRFVSEHDNCVDLASLHNYSEMRYLIGHKSFSDLMEEMVDDAVLHFDPNEGQAHLTEKGRLEIES